MTRSINAAFVRIALIGLGFSIAVFCGIENARSAPLILPILPGTKIPDALNRFSELAGFNIIASNGVSNEAGRVSFANIQDVDAEEALNEYLTANGLRYVKKGNLVIVMTEAEYEQRVGLELEQKEFPLQYIRAEVAAAAVSKIMSPNRGIVVVDPSGNQLVVFEYPNRFPIIENLISKLDREEETRVIAPQYAQVSDLALSLQNMLSQAVSYDIDQRSNRLIITDTPYHLDKLEQVVNQLDLKDLTLTKTYVLKYANAQDVADILSGMITGEKPADKRSSQRQRSPGSESARQAAAAVPQPDSVSARIKRDESRSIAPGTTRPSEMVDLGEKRTTAPASTEPRQAFTSEGLQEVRALGAQGTVVADPRTNTVIVTHSPAVLERIEEVITALDVETSLFVYQFENADLDTLEIDSKLENLLPGPSEDYQIDAATRKITFRAPKERADYVLQLFKEWDAPARQVFIEARILRVSLDALKDIGISLQSEDWAGPDNFNSKVNSLFPPNIGTSPQGLVQVGDLAHDEYTALLQALQNDTRSKILSNPKVAVLDRQQAQFQVVVDEPFVEVVTDANSDITRESTRFIPVGVTLIVEPEIRSNGQVMMDVRVEISSMLGFSTKNVPIVDRSQAQSSVMITDGHTMALGGLIVDEKMEKISKVPLLGDIPLLKYAFRSKSNDDSQSELIVFITPYISNTGTPEPPPDQIPLPESKVDLGK